MTDIEAMANLWNRDGLSMGQIASHYRMTRQQVAGIIHRNRDLFESRRDANGKKPRQPAVTASQTSNQRRQAFHAVKVAEEAKAAPVEVSGPISKEEAVAYDAARRPFAKDLMEIRDCQCKWWVSDGPLMFCAEEVVAGKSWCAHHLKRSKGKGTESERKATDALKRAA